jgi:hypothetical protein
MRRLFRLLRWLMPALAAAPAAAQPARPVVAIYHPLFEQTMWWGMTADELAQNYSLSARKPTPDGGFAIGLVGHFRKPGDRTARSIPPAPGTLGLQPYERAVYTAVFGPNGRLRRLDMQIFQRGATMKLVTPIYKYGQPLLMWRGQHRALSVGTAENVWVMNEYQIARVVSADEQGTSTTYNTWTGGIVDQRGYSKAETRWAALEYAPPGTKVRSVAHDPYAPESELFSGTRAQAMADGRVLVDGSFTMPGRPGA